MPLVLTETGPFYADGEGNPFYRACDFCSESAVEDAWAGREWRTFYLLPDGCCVCGSCVEAGRDLGGEGGNA